MLFKIFKFSGSISSELIRYCVCGGTATLVDVGTLWYLEVKTDLNYIISAGLAFSLAVLVSYGLSSQLIFRHYARHQIGLELAIFAIINLFSLGISLGVIACFSEANLLYSKALAIVLSIAWNFLAKKLVLFNKLKSD